MKFALKFAALIAIPTVLVGCATRSPYDYMENWAIREDPVRPFVVNADVIYVQGTLYTNHKHLTELQLYADSEVGHGRFGGIARVFSPLVSCRADIDLALQWYFDHHYEDGRFLIFIGEGVGGSLLRDYHNAHHEELLKKGLVGAYYKDVGNMGFVDKELVKEIKAALTAARYKSIWGREILEDDVDE